jgi:hypothetical protein
MCPTYPTVQRKLRMSGATIATTTYRSSIGVLVVLTPLLCVGDGMADVVLIELGLVELLVTDELTTAINRP